MTGVVPVCESSAVTGIVPVCAGMQRSDHITKAAERNRVSEGGSVRSLASVSLHECVPFVCPGC